MIFPHRALIKLLAGALILCATLSMWGQDTTPPMALSATYTSGSRDVFVTFSEPMALFPALDPFNYILLTPGFIGEADRVTQADPSGMIFRLSFLASIAPQSQLRIDYGHDLAGNEISPLPTTLLIQQVPEPSGLTIGGLALISLLILGGRKRLCARIGTTPRGGRIEGQ